MRQRRTDISTHTILENCPPPLDTLIMFSYLYKVFIGLACMALGGLLILFHLIEYGEINFDLLGHETYGIVLIVIGYLIMLKR